MTAAYDDKAKTNRSMIRRDFLRGAAVGAGAALVLGGLGVKVGSKIGYGAAIKPRGFSRARSMSSDTTLPQKVDVAIIGGGFVGASTALALAQKGVTVALFEKGVVAGEASGRAGGLIEAQFQAPEKMELVEYSKERWRKLNEITGEETGFLQKGSSVLFEKADDIAYAESWIESVKGLPNGDARMLTAAEAQARAPGTTAKIVGGITTSADGTGEPTLAAPAIALGARKLGAKIYQYCAVRGIERSAGAVSAVITEKGRVAASTVVLAGGVWSPMIGHDVGIDLPTVQCFAHPMSLQPFEGAPDYGTTSIAGKTLVGWRKQFDQGYVVWEFKGIGPILPTSISRYFQLRPAIEANSEAMEPRFNPRTFWRWMNVGGPVPLDRPGPYEQTRIYEPETMSAAIDEGFAHLQAVMPVFKNGPVRERWSGAMQMTVDNMPILSRVDTIPGLVVGSGLLYGLTMGPGAGLVLADLATGAKPAIDVSHFRYSRFTDGSKIQYYA
jgi:glycine/D-amino acid oxidase-like deaminating enzyme